MAAAMPCLATSPTISAVRTPGSGIASYQAPPHRGLGRCSGGPFPRWSVCRRPGEKPALGSGCDDPFTHVPMGVVEAQCGMSAHCGCRRRRSLLLEGGFVLVAVEADYAQSLAIRVSGATIMQWAPDDISDHGGWIGSAASRAVLLDCDEPRPEVGQEQCVGGSSGRTVGAGASRGRLRDAVRRRGRSCGAGVGGGSSPRTTSSTTSTSALPAKLGTSCLHQLRRTSITSSGARPGRGPCPAAPGGCGRFPVR